jgi:pyruvate dehydrogenase E1 component
MFETSKLEDTDPGETREWLESIDSVLKTQGAERAQYLLERVIDFTRRSGAYLPFKPNTAYVNTISTAQEVEYPGDRALEERVKAYIRWNAMAMVVQANRQSSEYGGHIASYASAATLYEVGFNHFWRAPGDQHPGDMVFIQGHSSPGIYARAYLEGRLTEEQLRRFREEVGGGGLSSYPHPWLMPDFWQFPTVSMGLGPMMAIYQARFVRYLEHRGIVPPSDRKVWAFLGDGETDEPSRSVRSRCRCARNSTTSCSSSTATCSDSMGRCAATARSSRNWRLRSSARLECHQGDLGLTLGSNCCAGYERACCDA